MKNFSLTVRLKARMNLKFRLRINDIIPKEYWWLCGKNRDTWNW